MSDATGEQGPRFPVVVRDHGDALAVGWQGETLALICERAHPPGRPLSLDLQLPDAQLALQGKTIGSKLRSDGAFDVRLRLSSVRREQRAALERSFPPR